MNGKTTVLRTILVMVTVYVLMTIVTTSAAEAAQDSTGITWDFETGDLSGWTKTGTAFDYQPTYGDNPTARRRGQASNHQGNYWIGTYEKYQGPDSGSTPGAIQGDGPTGTLTSIPFVINGNRIDFLIGGGKDCSADLIIGGAVVLTASGKNIETMERVEWDVSDYTGKEAVIQLVDDESYGWDHINFDDVRFDAAPTSEVASIQTPTPTPTPSLVATVGATSTPAVTAPVTECDETARAIIKAVGGCDAIDRAEYPQIYDACCKVTKEYILDLLNSSLADGTISPDEQKQLLKALDTYLGVRT